MLDIKVVQSHTDRIYGEVGNFLTPGKELIGKIKHLLQNAFKLNPNFILNPSSGLKSETFETLIN